MVLALRRFGSGHHRLDVFALVVLAASEPMAAPAANGTCHSGEQFTFTNAFWLWCYGMVFGMVYQYFPALSHFTWSWLPAIL